MLLILATGLLLVGLLPKVLVGADTEAESPEVSYSDQWADLEEQSTPFLNLRNDSPGGSVSTPEAPDTPSVQAVNVDGETVVVEAPTGEGASNASEERDPDTVTTVTDSGDTTTTTAEQLIRSDTEGLTDSGEGDSNTESEPAAPPDTGTERRVVDEGEDSESTDRTSESPDEVRREPIPDPEDKSQSASAAESSETPEVPESPDRSPNRVSGSPFAKTSPLDTGPALFTLSSIDSGIPSGTVATGRFQSDFSALAAVKYPRNPVPFWWQYYWWIVGGLVVTVTIGMFFWFRRRRVEVVDSSYPSADAFFQEQLKRKRNTVTPKESERPSDPQGTSTRPSGTAATTSSMPPDVGFNHGKLAERLREKGYEGEFERMLKLYYEENMTEEQIAERISRGAGAVGLVLDYADRLRKEMDHGKRA